MGAGVLGGDPGPGRRDRPVDRRLQRTGGCGVTGSPSPGIRPRGWCVRPPPPLLDAGPGHARPAAAAAVVPRDPGTGVVAFRRRPRPGDDPALGDARGARGAGLRHHRHRRSPRVARRHRGLPRRDRRRLRRGGGCGWCAPTGSPTATVPTAPAAASRRTVASSRPAAPAWSGVHAAFTCSDDTMAAAAALAAEFGGGVHVHVAEDAVDRAAADRLRRFAGDDWVLAHGVHLAEDSGVRGTVVHNPRSNLNNAVGYARPARFTNPVALGHRRHRRRHARGVPPRLRPRPIRQTSPRLRSAPGRGWRRAATWFPPPPPTGSPGRIPSMEPWHLAYTTGVRPVEIVVDGRVVWRDGGPTRVDPAEVRAKAAEQAVRLFARL